MNAQPHQFRFVVLEGCEGSGKSTQFKRIEAKYLNGVFFREPGGTEFAEKEMRRLLLSSPHSAGLTPYECMGLFFTGRSHNLRTFVAPARAKGQPVFSDRFDGSSFAYQLYGMEGKELLSHFESSRTAMGPAECLPTLYIVLDVSPEVGMARVKKRYEAKGEMNHFDTRGPEFHARVREGYRQFAKRYPDRVIVVDAEQTVEKVWADIEAVLDRHFAA
jgi:dTMP kinase